MKDKILVLDFGGQYDQLIARRVREQQVYAEICDWKQIRVEQIKQTGYKGIIFTGGPSCVNDAESPHYDPAVLNLGIPVLGICYGAQLIAHMAGGRVCPAAEAGEYGKTVLYTGESRLFQNVPEESVCWMSHNDRICELPKGFQIIAHTDQCPCAALSNEEKRIYGVQFHPEVTHTAYGMQIIRNFLFEICACSPSWKMEDYLQQLIERCKKEYDGKQVLLALSGGVDSSVAALVMHKAVGDRLTCVFVDHGMLRKGEGDFVQRTFQGQFGIKLIRINAEERFLFRLKGVTEPEEKRKVIGEEFIRVFEDAAEELGKAEVLCQGTIYPDVVESGKGDSAVIKSHHNVGGLPSVLAFEEVAEPIKDLFKDEVRNIGRQLGLPEALVNRQPFPGPGLAVRMLGEITKEKLEILREADAIFREEIGKSGVSKLPDQYFAVLTDMKSVGVKGDARTYGYVAALRAVSTDDFMTAEWSRIPWDVLERASARITNEIPEITRVVYDITSKPPATVEWE